MMSFKKILYPTDFSELSLCALPHAIQFAREFDAELHCLHVVDESYQYWLGAGDNVAPTIIPVQEVRETSQKQLDEFVEKHLAAERGIVTPKLVVGRPFVEIIHYARENSIDIIVIATHGHGGLASVLLGSVTEKVVRKAPCPVLTVRHPEHKFEMP